MTIKPCKYCDKSNHLSFQCYKIRKPIKKLGKNTLKYNLWKHQTAIPYLIRRFGYRCANCGAANRKLDVDHIKKRGSHPELVMNISNVRFLCRPCHIEIT